MQEITLNTLMTALSRPAHLPKLGGKSHLFISSAPTPFVAPKFNIVEGTLEALNREVIFVEASAAIGKSTIARYISAILGVAILDLSKVPVATGSLNTLLQELEAPNKSDPLAAFHSGHCPVIIDALDEGRLVSSEKGIESFLETTAELVQSDRTVTSRPKLIFFGRFESIEMARQWIEVTAPDVKRTTIRVGFFDKDGAWELIQAYAESTAKATPTSIYPGHQEAAKLVISAYFDSIENALGLGKGKLWLDEQGRAFAGYAPVLASIGYLIALIDNYIIAANRLKTLGGHAAWAVIESVLGEILTREQRKVRDPLKLHFKSALPDQVYDAEEQMALLAQYVQGQPLEGAKRVVLPSAETAKYQEMIQQQLPDHPFIKQHVKRHEFGNAVLGSVVLARAVYHGRSVSHDQLAIFSRQPFLWRSISSSLSTSALIDGAYVGHILNSYWNDPLRTGSPPQSVYVRPSTDEGSVIVLVPRLKSAPINFEATLPLKFYGLIKNCDIETPGKIILEGTGAPGAGKSFRLLGLTSLISASVEIDSDIIKFEGEIWLEAQELAAPPNLRLSRNGSKVGWGGQFANQFPWNKEVANLVAPYAVRDEDSLTQLVRECARRFPAGITLTLNPNYTPVEGDPQTRWTTRRFSKEFPKLIAVMHHHQLAASDKIGGAGFVKVRVRFSTNWGAFLSALENPSSQILPRNFIDEARREIR